MQKTPKGRKYLAIHAHFYQPPRENPWTGTIPRQASAAPYPDWNERIARECYIPNAYARINDSSGRVVEMVNNYEYLNFNFGPTLLTWLEKRYPAYYAKVAAAAAATRAGCGHSNAIAQAYNHTILPLATFDDRLTQILWGLADFERRFGFKAEAMWLPETAADADTLRLLIDQGLRYAILSPYQAEKIRAPGAEKWTDVSGGIFDTRRPYIWVDRSPDGTPVGGRNITLFFYDGPLSKAVAFEGAIRNSESFAALLASAFDAHPEQDQLLTVAVDGETFGHHHKFADMTLAHAFRHEIKKHGIETVNLASYLDAHPAAYEAEIKAGPDGDGTAWSCSHGVRRWKGGCDCGADHGGQTKWRPALRAALNLLRDAAAGLYRTQAGELLKDVWKARNDYVGLFTRPSSPAAEAFLDEHAARPLSSGEKSGVLKLLELQKDVSFMFTSCGWFFSDISRIEPVQNLKYAAKAAAALRDLGLEHIEKDFMAVLELAPSNSGDFINGRKVYETLARAEALTPEKLAAARLMECMLRGIASDGTTCSGPAGCTLTGVKKDTAGGLESATGVLLSENPLNLETSKFSFLYARQDYGRPVIWLSTADDLDKFRAISAAPDIAVLRSGAENLKASPICLEDLVGDEKSRAAVELVRSVRRRNLASLMKTLREYLRVLETTPSPELPAFTGLRREAEICAAFALETLFEELAQSGDDDGLNSIYTLAAAISRMAMTVRFPAPTSASSDCALNELSRTRRAPSPENLTRLLKLLKTAGWLGLHDAFFHLQNGLSELFAEVLSDPERWAPCAAEIKELYASSGMIIARFSPKLDELAGSQATNTQPHTASREKTEA